MNRPTNSGFELSPAKRALRKALLQKQGVKQSRAERIPKRVEAGPAPTSFAQQRLWFLNQLEQEKGFYNISFARRMEGELNLPALRRSLTEIVRRHESLRTTFSACDGEPQQVVQPPAPFDLPLEDLSPLPEDGRESAARRLASAEARRPFDLSAGPLLRAKLLKLGAREHVLLLTMHHIVGDGWSMGVFFGELSALYTAYAQGRPSPLPELEIQYADFATWQRQRLTGDRLEEQFSYWRGQLSGAPALLELPTDGPRPPVQSYRGATAEFTLSKGAAEQLKELSRREGATLFMTLLAAFNVLLARYSGQEDIVVGTPSAGRERDEIQPLIGFFVNTLVLRTELAGDPTFGELLRRVKEVVLGAHAHQDLPFEKLVEKLQPERSLSYQPLFQVLFQLQNAPRDVLALDGLRCAGFRGDGGDWAKFDLALTMSEAGQGLSGSFEYSTDLFERATIERLIGHFVNLLEGVAAGDCGRKISELPLLGEAERGRLLAGLGEAETVAPARECIHQLFERQAALTPDAVALIHGEQRLTYSQLNKRANQLAHLLRSRGVAPESLVGVCLERSPNLLISLLAIFKSGGAYVPLDPAYPQERVRFMLEDASVALLLTERKLAARLNAPSGGFDVLCPEDEQAALASLADGDPAPLNTPGQLAYCIYTSGSTGTPKGVAITHAGAVTMLRWAARTFDASDLSRVLASTSVCFDLSVFELFAPLTTGGAVVLAENALQLPSLPAASEVTLVNTVPSAMAELIRGGGLPPSVGVVNLAGEPLPRHLADKVYEQPRVRQLWNLYGPSEDTTYSTYSLVERGSERAPLIGRAVTNSRAYVLDRRLEPVPFGVAGELYLGGDGLARGYLGRAALTAERFVPDSLSGRPGERLYRTGDKARWVGGGELEYLGRIDRQVKLRGFRIELGEVESALRKSGAVRDAVVVVRETRAGDNQLVAYVVPSAEEFKPSELRQSLRGRLPEFMVPALFVRLEEIPLTPNGKINHRALPSPEQAEADREQYVAPRTANERMLAGLWADLLRVERVGVNDNFFELGGHSLLATRLTTRVREACAVELPLRSIFEAPTVELLARMIERQEGSRTEAPAAKITARPRGDGDLGQLLAQLASLSEEEVRSMLAAEMHA